MVYKFILEFVVGNENAELQNKIAYKQKLSGRFNYFDHYLNILSSSIYYL